jgi:hypothetical protein
MRAIISCWSNELFSIFICMQVDLLFSSNWCHQALAKDSRHEQWLREEIFIRAAVFEVCYASCLIFALESPLHQVQKAKEHYDIISGCRLYMLESSQIVIIFSVRTKISNVEQIESYYCRDLRFSSGWLMNTVLQDATLRCILDVYRRFGEKWLHLQGGRDGRLVFYPVDGSSSLFRKSTNFYQTRRRHTQYCSILHILLKLHLKY